jgi:hypothetical protein
MARIRSIKPELWTSEQVADCSTTARLLFIGLWNFADDSGVHPWNWKRVKMEIFPGDTFGEAEIEGWIAELLSVGLLIGYRVDTQWFIRVTGWHHQKIEKPNCRWPTEQQADEFADQSTTSRRPVDDRSTTSLPRIGEDRSGGEGRGEESISSTTSEDGRAEPTAPRSPKPIWTEAPVFPCAGNVPTWQPTIEQSEAWKSAYPAVDILAELRKAHAWLLSNNKKTAGGMPRFVHSWLSRATNATGPPRGGGYPSRDAAKAAATKSAFDTIRSLANGPDSGQSTGAGFLGVQPRSDT